MKTMYSKILCLNLSMLLLLACVLPVPTQALLDAEIYGGRETVLVDRAGEDYAAYRESSAQEFSAGEETELRNAPAPLLTSETNEPYRIDVGGTAFFSNEVKSGENWSYEEGALVLNNYNGSGISASGDLVIYSRGAVCIQGTSETYAGNSFGNNGIEVLGALDIYVFDGIMQVTGGSGTASGGNAIYADSFFCKLYEGTASIQGGNTSVGNRGGDGICANAVSIYGPTNSGVRLTSIGGASSFLTGSLAGCAIYAGNTYIGTDVVLRGGNAYMAAPAVYSYGVCKFGCINATLYGGRDASDKSQYPVLIDTSNAEDWYYNEHTTLTDYGTYYSITINQYNLRLLGNGGWRGYATYTDLEDYYPTYYHLSNYTFSRVGYTQVAWTNASGDLVSLDAYYRPVSNTHLDATWVETSAGDILLNGLSGKLDDGAYWRRYQNTASVTLPRSLTYEEKDVSLAGWGTNLQLEKDSEGVLTGAWYEPGQSVKSVPTTPTSLYALENNDASYVIYHPTDGAPIAGGNIVVQRQYEASCTDLDVYIVGGDDYLAAPEGYRFAGWSTAVRGNARYTGGEKVTVSVGSPLHLYATWTPLEYGYQADGCMVWVETHAKTIKIEVAETWYSGLTQPKSLVGAMYDANGKMLGCSVNSGGTYEQDGVITLRYTGDDLPQIKVFALNAGRGPAGSSILMDLPNMKYTATR